MSFLFVPLRRTRVYLCPDPDEVSRRAGRAVGKGGGDRGLVLEVDPVLHVELKRAMLTCLDWNTHDPSLILAGASDGTGECTRMHEWADGIDVDEMDLDKISYGV